MFQIKAADIHNFRGIEELQLELHPGINLIKGENGTGKTSILEAIASGLGGFVSGCSDKVVFSRYIGVDDIRENITEAGDGSLQYQFCTPVSVELTAETDQGVLSWKLERASAKNTRSTIQPRDIVEYAAGFMDGRQEEPLPLLTLLGAGRVWESKRARAVSPFTRSQKRNIGYLDSLIDASDMKLFSDWCLRMEQISWQKGRDIAEYQAVMKGIGHFLDLVDQKEDGYYRLYFDKLSEEIVLCGGESTLTRLSALSSGFQSLIIIASEIAFRMALLNPHLRESVLTGTPGVVLIDEIDMHLHPRWQWTILPALRKVFPQIQFIAATHAPILFASIQDAWLIDVESEPVKYSTSHFGLDVNEALSTYQDTTEYYPEIKSIVNDISDAMDREDYRNAESGLKNLIEMTGENTPVVTALQTRLYLEKSAV